MEPHIPTLYEWAGGEDAIQHLFRAFYDKVLKDDLIGPVFRNMSPDHPRKKERLIPAPPRTSPPCTTGPPKPTTASPASTPVQPQAVRPVQKKFANLEHTS